MFNWFHNMMNGFPFTSTSQVNLDWIINFIQKFRDELPTISGKLEEMVKVVEGFANRLTAVEKESSDTSALAATNEADIGILDGQVAGLEQQDAETDAKLRETSLTAQNNKSNISSLTFNVETLNDKTATLENKSTAVDASITDLTAKLKETSLTAQGNKSNISSLTYDVENLNAMKNGLDGSDYIWTGPATTNNWDSVKTHFSKISDHFGIITGTLHCTDCVSIVSDIQISSPEAIPNNSSWGIIPFVEEYSGDATDVRNVSINYYPQGKYYKLASTVDIDGGGTATLHFIAFCLNL